MITKLKKSGKSSFLKNLFLSILSVFLFMAIIGFLTSSNWRINQKRSELGNKIAALQEEIMILEQKNEELRQNIGKTEQDDYWKGRAYEQGYVESGAQQVVILPLEIEEAEEGEKKTFWHPQSWWEWFKNLWRE